jgi:ATP-dependent protease ClpP protease subunit
MPNAKIMLHGSIGAVDDNGIVKQISQLRYAAKEEGRLDMIYLEQIRKKIPSFTFKQLRAKLNKDWYLTAEETVKLGLADEIGE